MHRRMHEKFFFLSVFNILKSKCTVLIVWKCLISMCLYCFTKVNIPREGRERERESKTEEGISSWLKAINGIRKHYSFDSLTGNDWNVSCYKLMSEVIDMLKSVQLLVCIQIFNLLNIQMLISIFHGIVNLIHMNCFVFMLCYFQTRFENVYAQRWITKWKSDLKTVLPLTSNNRIWTLLEPVGVV